MSEGERREAGSEEYVSIAIPASLYNRIRELIKGTGFTSVSQYVVHVLREVVAAQERGEPAISKEDEERIKERLRDLGYI